MKVEKILENKGSEVYSIHVDAIVSEALQVMSEKNIGALIVLDGQQNAQGIVSERDIMRNCYRSQANVKGLAVRDVMTPREKLIVARARKIERFVEALDYGPMEDLCRHLKVEPFRRMQ